LGVPFNIASYALLTMMIAQQVDMVPGDFIWTGGDCHIYNNHVEQVGMQLSRVARPLPAMQIKKASSIFDYQYEDFTLLGYDPHPAIKGEISV
jgi:thymidylate synthase